MNYRFINVNDNQLFSIMGMFILKDNISKTMFLFMWLGLLLCSCGDRSNDNVDDLLGQIDSLKNENQRHSKEMKEMTEFIDIISESLDSIAEQENLLKSGSKDGKAMTKVDLKAALESYSELLERQRGRIAQLEDLLSNKSGYIGSLRGIIAHLNTQLDEKDMMIANLQASLDKKDVTVKQLNRQVSQLVSANTQLDEQVKAQGEALVTQSEMMNECYMKVGTKKELQEAGVLTEGNLLKMKKSKLDPNNFKNVNFEKVNIQNFKELTLQSKKVEILTQMPKSSYRLTTIDKQTTLYIVDPTNFWSISNYLVVLIK